MVRIISYPWTAPSIGSSPQRTDEFIGRNASGTDRLSIAVRRCEAGWRVSGHRPHYDEYIVVLSGVLVIITPVDTFSISRDQAAMISAGECVEYRAEGAITYLSVCLPAFRSAGCASDDGVRPEPGGDGVYHLDYREYGAEGLFRIEPLWTMLRDHHARMARHFRSEHEFQTFAERCEELLEKNRGRTLLVHIARETTADELIGYCVSSAAPGDYGEVESIYVHPSYRVHRVGSTFMERASSWMEEVGVTGSRVMVFEGNEEVFPFYARFGFHPHRHLLTRRHDEEG